MQKFIGIGLALLMLVIIVSPLFFSQHTLPKLLLEIKISEQMTDSQYEEKNVETFSLSTFITQTLAFRHHHRTIDVIRREYVSWSKKVAKIRTPPPEVLILMQTPSVVNAHFNFNQL